MIYPLKCASISLIFCSLSTTGSAEEIQIDVAYTNIKESLNNNQVEEYNRNLEGAHWYTDVDPKSIVEKKRAGGFKYAFRESYGFFYDVTLDDWERMKQITRTRQNDQHRPGSNKLRDRPGRFYNDNWEAEFSCAFEKRIGNMGDGGKWVCDPHRISYLSDVRKTADGRDDPCLVYSIGSAGVDDFERGLMDEIGEDVCEIHTFEVRSFEDMNINKMNEEEQRKSDKINFHYNWGLISSKEEPKPGFKSLEETIKILGHEGRTIDIFKIDCESCEWETYKDWISASATPLQILVEVHKNPRGTNKFFRDLEKAGYVIFHKEPNIISEQRCIEYGLLKLYSGFKNDKD